VLPSPTISPQTGERVQNPLRRPSNAVGDWYALPPLCWPLVGGPVTVSADSAPGLATEVVERFSVSLSIAFLLLRTPRVPCCFARGIGLEASSSPPILREK